MITIGDGIPTDGNLRANAEALARYAELSQEAGIVPIVEPEVLMDADNSLDVCREVTTRTLSSIRTASMRISTRRSALKRPRSARIRSPSWRRCGFKISVPRSRLPQRLSPSITQGAPAARGLDDESAGAAGASVAS